MNKFIIIASLLLASMGAWAAQTVSTVVTPSASAGTLTYKIEDRVCTLTATPASGYYLTKDYITAVTSLDGAGVQSRRNAPANIDITSETLEISGNASADPSGVTTYTFVMPEDENINVTVTAEFQTLIAITPTVTLEGWTFGQAANTPVVGNNPSTGQVTITYAVKDSEKFSETVPTTVGNYTVKATVAAAREYAAGEATADFSITAKAVTATMIADIDNQTYTGVAITPALTVTDGETTLVLNTDYTVAYSDNTNAGTATATITGKGNYSGTASKTFTIGKAAITDVTLAETSLTYTGASQTVAVSSVKAGTLTLTADDYTVSGNTATTAGSYTVTVAAAEGSNFSGSKTATFSIAAKTVTASMIADIDNQTYTGVAITPTLTVTDGEATLVLDTDYTVVYSDNTNAGTATATITGKGNYSGTASKTFTIGKAAITDVTLAETSLTYTGASQTVAVSSVKAGTLTLTADDYTVSGNMATTAGSYTVTVAAAEGSNFSGSKTATFSITAKAVAADMIATIEDQTYTGAAITPALTVTDGETTLVLNTDYTVAYSDNTNAGTATATITGKGNYTGTASKTFTIGKATLTVTADDLTVNAGDTFTLTFQYSGFVNNETKSVLTKEPAASTGSQDISNPGTYEITVSGGEAANYDFTYESGTLTVKRELNISFSSNEWATYYATEDLATPTGLQAYKVTAIEATEVTAVGISYIPKNVAVLLKKSESANVQESYAAKAYTGQTSTFTDNVLQGTAVANSVSNISGGTVYVLYNDEFVKTVSGEIPANRGYLVVAAVNARSLSIVIDEEATGIDDALRLNEQRTYNAVYDLQGRCVSNGQLTIDNGQLKPGLYIINGKKVFIK